MRISALVKSKYLSSTPNVITNVKIQTVFYFKDLQSRSKYLKKIWFSSPTCVVYFQKFSCAQKLRVSS